MMYMQDNLCRVYIIDIVHAILYSLKSAKEMGIMYQLLYLIYRSVVRKDRGENMKAADVFMEVVVYAHAVAAAEIIQNLSGTREVADIARAIVIVSFL